MEKQEFIAKAKEFAREAHSGQVRKYTGLPYTTHTEEVAQIVDNYNGSKEMIAAALLHDTVEDTSVTIQDIEKEFGSGTAMLVKWLTDTSRPEDGNLSLIHI